MFCLGRGVAGCDVWGVRCRRLGQGFCVKGVRGDVWVVGCRVQGAERRVKGVGCRM